MQRASIVSLGVLANLFGCAACSPKQVDDEHRQLAERSADGGSATAPEAGIVEVKFESAYVVNVTLIVELTTPMPIYVQRCNDEERGMDALEPGQGDWLDPGSSVVGAGSFVNGTYYEDELGCDFLGCVQLKQFRARVDRLEQVGEIETRAEHGMPLPANWNDAGAEVDGGKVTPIYESREVSGRVRIWFKYHQADDCSDGRTEYQHELDLDVVEHLEQVP